jgi:hypothetical protein
MESREPALASPIEQSEAQYWRYIGVKIDIISNGAVSRFSCNGSSTSESSTSSGIVRICTTESSGALRVELDTFFVASISMHRADIAGWYLSL